MIINGLQCTYQLNQEPMHILLSNHAATTINMAGLASTSIYIAPTT